MDAAFVVTDFTRFTIFIDDLTEWFDCTSRSSIGMS